MRRKYWCLLVAILCAGSAPAPAGVIDAVVLNATTNGVGDDLPGLSTGFVVSSSVAGVDDPEGAFGRNTGPVEPNTFIFGDGGTPDNGDGVLGNGGEAVDTLSWNTTMPVMLEGYYVGLASDGISKNRGTELVQLKINGEVDDVFDNNASSGGIRTFAIPQLASSFELAVTHSTLGGARVVEIDGLVPGPMLPPVHVSQTLFNAVTNSVGDEPAGLATNFASSLLYPGDSIEDAFGNNNGGVEPTSLLFADGGVPDNGNNTFDLGLETIDFISWDTIQPIELFGYQVHLASDFPNKNRGSELVRFYVNGVLQDTIDFNSHDAVVDRLFSSGPVTGSSFRIELTRNLTDGPRVYEINAIVPEPATWLSALIGALVVATCAGKWRRSTAVSSN